MLGEEAVHVNKTFTREEGDNLNMAIVLKKSEPFSHPRKNSIYERHVRAAYKSSFQKSKKTMSLSDISEFGILPGRTVVLKSCIVIGIQDKIVTKRL